MSEVIWAEWEKQVLIDTWPVEGYAGCKRQLNHKSEGAIRSKARSLGLEYDPKAVGTSVTVAERNKWLMNDWRPGKTFWFDRIEMIEQRLMRAV